MRMRDTLSSPSPSLSFHQFNQERATLSHTNRKISLRKKILSEISCHPNRLNKFLKMVSLMSSPIINTSLCHMFGRLTTLFSKGKRTLSWPGSKILPMRILFCILLNICLLIKFQLKFQTLKSFL